MTYYLTLKFPEEKYSINKNSNEFLAKDKEGNRFIMNADSDQKGKISFCKDDGSECDFTQHYAVIALPGIIQTDHNSLLAC